MNKKTIKVTQDHINNGKPKACDSCPIALALIEAGYKTAKVYDDNIQLAGAWFEPLSPQMLDFIKKFDSKEPVEPFEFQIPYL